jgi:hypothetical protein
MHYRRPEGRRGSSGGKARAELALAVALRNPASWRTSRLYLGYYRTAWLLLQRIRASMDERSEWPLTGLVEVDETRVGAQGNGDLLRRENVSPHVDLLLGNLKTWIAGTFKA